MVSIVIAAAGKVNAAALTTSGPKSLFGMHFPLSTFSGGKHRYGACKKPLEAL